MGLRDRKHIKDVETMSGNEYAIFGCPKCGADNSILAKYFESGSGSKGFTQCSGCSQKIRYNIPKKSTEFEKLEME